MNNLKTNSENSSTNKPANTGRGVVFYVTWALQLGLAGIFLYSAIAKMGDLFTFGEILRSYGILPDALIKPMAVLVPLAEILASVLLLIPRTAKWGAYGVVLLSLFFFVALLKNWGQVMPYGCGCFGPTEAQTVGIVDVGKDVLLMAAAGLLAGLRRRF